MKLIETKNHFWMPPNKQLKEREGVHLTHHPRPIRYFKKYGKNDHGWWNIDTMALSLDTIRAKFWWNFADTPEATKNLQTWINNLGQALYNPCHWYLSTHRRKIDGGHRMKVLEAMNFDYVYIYLITGLPKFPSSYWDVFRVNDRIPTKTASMRPRRCPVCGELLIWRRTEHNFVGECNACDYNESDAYIYPKPVSIQISNVS